MNARDESLRILKWISAGGGTDLPIVELGTPEIIRVLLAHKVLGRFLALTQKQADVVSGIDLDLLWSTREAELAGLARLDRELEKLGLVIEAEQPTAGPIIRLKGNAAANHLGRPDFLRKSQDLDLLAEDAEALGRLLASQGYVPHGAGICHEDAHMVSPDEIPADVHRYFPSWSYSVDGASDGSYGIVSTPVFFGDFLASSVDDPRVASPWIRIPGVTAAAFLICLHVFRDYVEVPFAKPLAKVRLGEVLEFGDLVAHRGFDADAFEELVQRFGASDALSFMQLLRSNLELPPLPIVHDRAVRSFPRELARGVLIAEDLDAENLLMRKDDFGTLFQKLSPVPVVIGRTDAVTVTTLDAESRLCWPPAHEQSLNFEAELTLREDILCVRFALSKPCGHYKDEVAVVFADEVFRVQREADSARMMPLSGPQGFTAEWEANGTNSVVTLEIPLRSAAAHGRGSRPVEIILQAHRFRSPLTEDWNAFYSESLESVVLPITLTGLVGWSDR